MTDKKKLDAYLKALTIWVAMYEMIETVRKVCNQPPNLLHSFMYGVFQAAKEEAQSEDPNIERVEFLLQLGTKAIETSIDHGEESTK